MNLRDINEMLAMSRTQQLLDDMYRRESSLRAVAESIVAETKYAHGLAGLSKTEEMERLGLLGNVHDQMMKNAGATAMHLSDLAGGLSGAGQAANKIWEGAHNSWLPEREILDNRFTTMADLARDKMLEAANFGVAAECLSMDSHFEILAQSGYNESLINSVQNTYGQLETSFDSLISSFETMPDVFELPDHVLPGASHGLFLTGYAVQTVAEDWDFEDEDEEIVDPFPTIKKEVEDCPRLLFDLDPSLVKVYHGAKSAIKSGNPDKTRHALSSMRELCNHVLRTLAPDDEIALWTKDPQFYYRGKPTRRARVSYIYRSFGHESLVKFTTADIGANVKLINFFNHVHDVNLELTQEQLQSVMLKTESFLVFILKNCKYN